MKRAAIAQQADLFAEDTPDVVAPGGPETAPEDVISRRVSRKAATVLKTRQNREEGRTDLGYHARPFALCNLPVRPVKNGRVWERRNGDYFLRMEATEGKMLPYGQDRLVLILVATMAVRQQSRAVQLGTASDILRHFGQNDSGYNYNRLMDSFDRIFSAVITWGLESRSKDQRRAKKAHLFFLESMDLWFRDEARAAGLSFQNRVTLSEPFFNELREHPIPVDMEAVRGLLDSPAALDFYVWVVLRTWKAEPGPPVRIPLFGPFGLREQFGSEVKAPAKFRQMVKGWLRKTVAYWPDCPAQLSADGETLVLSHGKAIQNPQLTRATEFSS